MRLPSLEAENVTNSHGWAGQCFAGPLMMRGSLHVSYDWENSDLGSNPAFTFTSTRLVFALTLLTSTFMTLREK
jgi:hypothetical protein